MKKILTAIISTGLMLTACDFQHPEAVVLPDPVFDSNGLQMFDAISIYETVDVGLDLSRVYGVSKELQLDIAIDEALITEYNELNNGSYTLMPSEYYECPESVTFSSNTQKTVVPVKVQVKKLVADKGLEAANKMIIPVRMTTASMEVEDAATAGYVLVNMAIETPQIDVNVPDAKTLSFISAFPVKQTVSIASAANFTTLDAAKVKLSVAEDKVEAFNTANETSHVLLPAGSYTIKEDVFDKENLSLTSNIEFDCASLSDENTYILPLVMEQEDEYEIIQSAPIYVVVELTELKISVTGGGQLLSLSKNRGTITAALNSPITENFAINFKYDADKVAEYNAANGTSYEAADASKLTITASEIVAGTQEGTVAFELDWSNKEYDDGVKILIPLTLDGILEGTEIIGESTIYMELTKSISGHWSVEAITPMYPAAVQGFWGPLMGSTIWLADGKTELDYKTIPESGHGQKYAIIYGGGWTDGVLYFNVDFANEMEDKPGCYKIIDWRDRVAGYDQIVDYNSYYDSIKEEFNFDFVILADSAPGHKGNPLEDPSHVPGLAKYSRLYDKQ